MIIKSFEANKLKIKEFNLYLFYGKSEGHKNEIIESTFLNKFTGIVNKYDETDFILNFQTIGNEILTKSLFEEEKIIIVSRASDKILKYIEEIKLKNLENTIILLKCGPLEKKSKVRNLFEKDKELIIIPFYEDTLQTLSTITVEFLTKNKIKTSREAVNLLVSRSNGDRQNLKIELEKILNFSISKKNIDLETVEKLSNLS